MKLRDRARRLFGRDNLAEHTVVASRVEHAVLSDLRRRAPQLDSLISEPPTLPNGESLNADVWGRCAEDLWSELYGLDSPTLRARDKVDQKYRINRELAAKHAKDDGFEELHGMTRGQSTESALGLMKALGSLAQSYEDELADAGEKANEVADAEDTLDQIDDELAKLREERSEAGEDELATFDDMIREKAADKRVAQAQVQVALDEQATNAGDIADAAAQAVAKAAEAAQEGARVAASMPGSHHGPGVQVPLDLALAFAERVAGNPHLQKILDLLGRLEISMGTVRREFRKGGYEEMVDIETGDDLRLVLPQEKALLVHPIARLDFYRRFHERSLMQYEMWSEEELKKGPLIFGADGSDSMRGAKDRFCRGLTLASCEIANRESRNAAAIEFGSTGEMREFWFPAGQPLNMNTALDFAEHFFAGGTNIDQVLERAVEMINEEAPFHSADLVIVTDGVARLSDRTYELRDELRSMGVKIHGIAVGMAPTHYMLEVCDNSTALMDYAGPNEVSNRLAIDLT